MEFNDYQKAIIERLKLQHGTTVGFRDIGDRSTEKVLVFADGFEWLTCIHRATDTEESFQVKFNGECYVIWDTEWEEFLDDDFQFENKYDAEIVAWEFMRERYNDHVIAVVMAI